MPNSSDNQSGSNGGQGTGERVAALLTEAVGVHRNGQLREAAEGYQAVLGLDPRNFDALHMLGVALFQAGGAEQAVEVIEAAIEVRPDDATARANLGNALRALGRHRAAMAAFDKAIALAPNHADAWFNRANLLGDLGRNADALESYGRTIALAPDFGLAYKNRASVLRAMGRHEEALSSYREALARTPDFAESHFGLGNVLADLGRHEEALSSYDRAVTLAPRFGRAHNNRATALAALGRYEDALAGYEAALDCRPDFPEAHYNMGNVLRRLRRFAEAIAAYDAALAAQPDYPEAHNDRGNVLLDLDRAQDALADYDAAVALRPDFADAQANAGVALRALGRPEEAIERFAAALEISPDLPFVPGALVYEQLGIADWTDLEARTAAVCEKAARGLPVCRPFPLLALTDAPAVQRAAAEAYVRTEFPREAATPRFADPSDDGRIRIGYFSSDFREHATSQLLAGVIEHHDRSRFEVSGYAFGPADEGAMRRRLAAAFDRFEDVGGLTDAGIAKHARAAGVDIAIDLNGFTANGRFGIFTHRAAPVQVNYLGYPATSGSACMDYIIADGVVVPAAFRDGYSERLVTMPHSYQPNDDTKRVAAETPARADLGLPEDGVVFCCFNNTFKITPDVFAIWMRLLARVEGSVLWLLEGNAAATRNLRAHAEAAGIDPRRLVFAPRVPLDQHLARHRAADLFLDTVPYNAHTTASDALWAGLPIVAQAGEAFAARVVAGVLNALEMPELVADGPKAYEALALELAIDPDRRRAVRETLERNRASTPLFDTDAYTRHLEAAFERMHARRVAGEPAEDIVIRPWGRR